MQHTAITEKGDSQLYCGDRFPYQLVVQFDVLVLAALRTSLEQFEPEVESDTSVESSNERLLGGEGSWGGGRGGHGRTDQPPSQIVTHLPK